MSVFDTALLSLECTHVSKVKTLNAKLDRKEDHDAHKFSLHSNTIFIEYSRLNSL